MSAISITIIIIIITILSFQPRKLKKCDKVRYSEELLMFIQKERKRGEEL